MVDILIYQTLYKEMDKNISLHFVMKKQAIEICYIVYSIYGQVNRYMLVSSQQRSLMSPQSDHFLAADHHHCAHTVCDSYIKYLTSFRGRKLHATTCLKCQNVQVVM